MLALLLSTVRSALKFCTLAGADTGYYEGGSCYCAHFTKFSSTLHTFDQPSPFQLCLPLNHAAARKTTYSHNIKNHWYTQFYLLEGKQARGQRGSNEPNKLPHGSATDQFNTPVNLLLMLHSAQGERGGLKLLAICIYVYLLWLISTHPFQIYFTPAHICQHFD